MIVFGRNRPEGDLGDISVDSWNKLGAAMLGIQQYFQGPPLADHKERLNFQVHRGKLALMGRKTDLNYRLVIYPINYLH